MASNTCGTVFKAHSSYTSPQGSSYTYSHLPSSQKHYTAPVEGTNYDQPRRSRSDLLSNSVVLEGRELRGVASFHGDTNRSIESCQPRSFPQPSPSQSSPSQPFHSLGSHGNESTVMPPLHANPPSSLLGTPVDLPDSCQDQSDPPPGMSSSAYSQRTLPPSRGGYGPQSTPPPSRGGYGPQSTPPPSRGGYDPQSTRSQSEGTLLVPGGGGGLHSDQQSAAAVPDHHRQNHPNTGSAAHSTSHRPSNRCFSKATLENERYSLDGLCTPDHANEDRYFSLENSDYRVFAVFDGHDGGRAAGFASSYMHQLFVTPSWNNIVAQAKPAIIHEALNEFFKVTEQDFFKSIQRFIAETEYLQSIIPQNLSSYEAYQQYPSEVSRLQELEPKITGGCTAVLAILVQDRLYVANVGDSRALLVSEKSNGTISVEQLSVDHSVENEEELKRLEGLGLDPKVLIRNGRLGMHENVRSIGDYSIKQGYTNVDTLKEAYTAPGIATPYIMPTKTVDHTHKYLVLMTDGVYKSIESTMEQQACIESNKVLANMLEHSLEQLHGDFDRVSDSVLSRICKIHRDSYQRSARKDPRSSQAVSCRKRDDMTLLVYRFPSFNSQ